MLGKLILYFIIIFCDYFYVYVKIYLLNGMYKYLIKLYKLNIVIYNR